MSIRIGDAGGIMIAPEATYGTPGTYVPQHGRSASIGPRKTLQPSPRLNPTELAARKYTTPFSDGEITLAYDRKRTVIGDIWANVGKLTTDTYSVGVYPTVTDMPGLSVWVDYGGYAMEYTGQVITGFRLNFAPNEPVELVLTLLGRNPTNETPITITPPSLDDIIYDTDVGAITVTAAAMCAVSGSIDVRFPLVGSDRRCLGSVNMRKPQLSGMPVITASLALELDDSTGSDSEAALALFLSGTTAGDVVIGDFTLSNCFVTGDFPALGSGITQFPLNVQGNELAIVTAT